MQESIKRDRMIGSMLALVLGISGLLSAVVRASQGEDASVVAGLSMLLGAVAYRSRKHRLLGLRAESGTRIGFEVVCLVLLSIAWLALHDLGTQIIERPVEHLVIPIWALVAYGCAGLRIRPKTSEGQQQAPESRTNGPAVLVLALVLGATAAYALRGQDEEVRPEPGRPPQTVLDAVRPLGLSVSMGDPFEVPPSTDDEGGWFVPVECRIADSEAQRYAAPSPAERWLFGVLWGDGLARPLEPRSYIQPVPKLTLSLSSTPGGEIHEAAWAIFGKCQSSTERILLPLWPEDAAILIGGPGAAWMRADGLGLPRNEGWRGESFEEVIESTLLPMALALATGDGLIPVDGLVNGGPVFDIVEFTINSELSNIPSSAEQLR